MDVVERYFWVLALAVSVYNVLGAEWSGSAYRGLDPAQQRRARRLRVTFAVISALPWLVMGAGTLTGATPQPWHYFRPQDRNPFVLGFVGVVFLSSVIIAVWTLFLDGARTAVTLRLVVMPGAPAGGRLTEAQIKLFAGLAPVGVIVWVLLATLMDVPLPGSGR